MQIRHISLSTASETQRSSTIITSIKNSLSIASRKLSSLVRKTVNTTLYLIEKGKSRVGEKSSDTSVAVNGNKKKNYKGVIRAVLLLIAVTGVALGVSRLLGDRKIGSSSGEQVKVKSATKDQIIGKEFSFPLRDDEGEEVSKVVYAIEKVELRDEIMVQGQKAVAVQGRTFLILTLKIKNEFTNAIQIETKDYIRLSVNDNKEEWLAPDIHNDPVEVQAISTKYTRLGFPINTDDSNLVLRVGEIDGDKEMVELELN